MAEVGPPPSVTVSPMRAEHVRRVAEIERESFTTPWSEETFGGLLGRSGVVILVMTGSDGEILGYSVLWCILDQGELANIAIESGHRRLGYGRLLLEHVLDEARVRGVEELFLEVRASNAAAIRLYESFGFTRVGLRKDYYDRPREDAHLMVVHL